MRSLVWLYQHLGRATEGKKEELGIYFENYEKKLIYELLPHGVGAETVGLWFSPFYFLLMESQPRSQLFLSPSLIAENTFFILFKSLRRRVHITEVLTLSFQTSG